MWSLTLVLKKLSTNYWISMINSKEVTFVTKIGSFNGPKMRGTHSSYIGLEVEGVQ